MFLYRRKRLCSFVSFLLSGAIFLSSSFPSYGESAEEENARREAITVESNEIFNWPQGPVTHAQSAILMDANTHAILYEKNVHEKLYPASITKILSCLIATEHVSDLSEMIDISYEAVHSVPIDGTNVGLDAGEQITFEDALYAVLLKSANEATNAIGEHVGGSIDQFVQLMNEKAAELGCMDSHFVTTNGIHDENHYTSAYDMALIGSSFFSNELLCKISGTKYHQIPVTDTQPDLIDMYSSNQLLPGREYAYPYIVGSKTGYTSLADSTLVSCAEKDGLKLICVVMGENAPYHYVDTTNLFDYGFSNFSSVAISEYEKKYTIHTSDFFQSDFDVFGNSKQFLSLDSLDCLLLPNTVSFDELESTLDYESSTEHVIATIHYYYQDHFLGDCKVLLNSQMAQEIVFDSLPTNDLSSLDTLEPANKLVFINVIPIVLIILSCLGVVILFFLVKGIMKNYHISPGSFERLKNKSRSHHAKRSSKETFFQKKNQKSFRKNKMKKEHTPLFSRRKRRSFRSSEHFETKYNVSKDTRSRLRSPRKKQKKRKSMNVSIRLSKDHFD